MSVTIYPVNNKSIEAFIQDGSPLDDYTRTIMEYIICGRKLHGMGVYEGEYIINWDDVAGLELAMTLMDFEIFKEKWNQPNGVSTEKSAALEKLKSEIAAVVQYCRDHSVDIMHSAD